MPLLPAGSIDLIFTDLPFGTTSCKWDCLIPFDELWPQFKRLLKPKGCVVLHGSQPFTSALVMSNPKWFRHEIIWEKGSATGFLDAKRKPLKAHENIIVFAPHRTTYNPQMTAGKPYSQRSGHVGEAITADPSILGKSHHTANPSGDRYPRSVQRFNVGKDRGLHPTQKPVGLCEWIIKTYSNPGELVLDCCAGSGSTGQACANTGRNFIGIEKDPNYFKIMKDRLENFTPLA